MLYVLLTYISDAMILLWMGGGGSGDGVAFRILTCVTINHRKLICACVIVSCRPPCLTLSPINCLTNLERVSIPSPNVLFATNHNNYQ